MRRMVTSLMLALVLVMSSFTTAFAMECDSDSQATEAKHCEDVSFEVSSDEITEDGIVIPLSAKSSSTVTYSCAASGVYQDKLSSYFPYNPTVSVTISGNSNCYYEVTLMSSSNALQTYTYGQIKGNGSTTESHTFSLASRAQYYVTISPYNGTVSGQTLTVTFHITY